MVFVVFNVSVAERFCMHNQVAYHFYIMDTFSWTYFFHVRLDRKCCRVKCIGIKLNVLITGVSC